MSELMVVEGQRLGRKAPLFDPLLLAIKRYLDPTGLPTAPPACDLTAKAQNPFGVMLNDSLGCCTCSEAGHAVQIWTANSGTEVTVPDQAVLTLYEAVGNYVPGDPSTDQGAVISNVMAYLRSVGIDGHKIGAYGTGDPSDTSLCNTSIWVFGGLATGWALPIATQGMGSLWDVPAGSSGSNWQAGSWGGHDVGIFGYDTKTGNRIGISWGNLVTITPSFWGAYCEEVWIPVSPDWIDASGTSPDGGFDTAQLDQDLGAIAHNVSGLAPDPQRPHLGFLRTVEKEIEKAGKAVVSEAEKVKAELEEALVKAKGSKKPERTDGAEGPVEQAEEVAEVEAERAAPRRFQYPVGGPEEAKEEAIDPFKTTRLATGGVPLDDQGRPRDIPIDHG